LKRGTSSKKKIEKTLTIFSSTDANMEGRWGKVADKGMDGGISLTNFSTHIFGVIMIGFRHSFFS
jgi:hypothetical protein